MQLPVRHPRGQFWLSSALVYQSGWVTSAGEGPCRPVVLPSLSPCSSVLSPPRCPQPRTWESCGRGSWDCLVS